MNCVLYAGSCRGCRRRMSLSFANVVARLSTCVGVIIRREIIITLYIVTMYRLLDDDDRWTNIIFRTIWFTTSLSFSLCRCAHTTASSNIHQQQPSQQAAADLTNEICQIFVLVITIATRQLHSMLRSTIIIPTRTWGLCFALLPQLRWNEYVYLFIRRQEGELLE